MPHITVKLFPGRTEEQKKEFTEEIVRKAAEILGCRDRSLSVAFEEVDEDEWNEKVYGPEILAKQGTLTKKPGYGSLVNP